MNENVIREIQYEIVRKFFMKFFKVNTKTSIWDSDGVKNNSESDIIIGCLNSEINSSKSLNSHLK